MGTPALAATVLGELVQHHDVVGVYTRPDAVRGRGKRLVPSEVKSFALEQGIPVFTPGTLRDGEALRELEALAPDAICVSAYGAILPEAMLDAPAYGCLNVHTSLLPRWRGAAPIERAILSGDERTGVCIMKMEKGLDTGPVCVREEVEVGDKSAAMLTEALAQLGAKALVKALGLVESGQVAWVPQSGEGVTYAAKIEKGELSPTLEDDARMYVAKVRASSAAHPARAQIAGRSLAIEGASLVEDADGKEICSKMGAGDAVFAHKRLFVGAADAGVEILRVRPDGKKSMEAKAFAGGIQGIKTASIRWGRC